MKTYIDAELMIVRLSNNDIVTLSIVETTTSSADAADRMGRESWDAGY